MSTFFGARGLSCGMIVALLWLCGALLVVARDTDEEEAQTTLPPRDESDDDTPKVETESTIDEVEEKRG